TQVCYTLAEHNTHVNSMPPSPGTMLPKWRCLRGLVLKSDFLTLDTANNNACRVFWNDFVVVQHFEFYSNISNFPRISPVRRLTLCSILAHVPEHSLRPSGMCRKPVRDIHHNTLDGNPQIIFLVGWGYRVPGVLFLGN